MIGMIDCPIAAEHLRKEEREETSTAHGKEAWKFADPLAN
jgi:hypothetical protein